MQPVSSVISPYFVDTPLKGPTSERASLLEEFVIRINSDRVGTKYKPLPAKVIAVMTSHIALPDLYYFYSICKQSDNFSKMFFGRLKKK